MLTLVMGHRSLAIRPTGALRVAHYRRCRGTAIGGGDSYVLSVAKEQRAQGLDPVVVTNPCAPILRLASELNLPTIEMAGGPLRVPTLPHRLAELIRCEGFDLVHTHHRHPFWVSLGCRLAKVPHVGSLHRGPSGTARSDGKLPRRGIGSLPRLSLGLADRLIPVSRACRDWHVAQGLDPQRMTVVYNGVDPRLYGNADRERARGEMGLPADAFVFGIVGWLSSRKGHEHFIEAGARVCEKRPKAHLMIVGHGRRRRKLEALAHRLGIADRCHFTGFRWDIPWVLAAFDCLVSASLREGLPMVMLEAMASSLPVVATSVGGVPELVLDGETGYLAEPRCVAALEEEMLRMMDNLEMAREMGRRGRLRVEECFTLEGTVRQLTQVYLEVLGRRGTRNGR